MPMNSQQDLPLKKDIAARFVPQIVGLMVYLGTLCFVFTLFMIQETQSWENQFTAQLTLEIPTSPGTTSAPLQSRVLQLLNRTPGIHSATAVPKKEIATLLHSLLGNEINMDLLSLPIVIDISLNEEEKVDIPSLEAHLKIISPQIQLNDHRSWQRQVSGFIQMSVAIALTITLLILLVALATTVFATRTSLLIHRQVIEVLSLIGATPSYIAKQFQMNALKQGLIASTVGSVSAFLTFIGIGIFLEKGEFLFAMNSIFFSQALCVFICAPLFTALLMMVSVRFSVMRALRS
jgi:cell division transport system permease protein